MATINYNDQRLTKYDTEKEAVKKEDGAIFDNAIAETDTIINQGIADAKAYGETQAKNQQDRTDFIIEQQEQNKALAKKDFEKEGRAAYVDYQKQTDQYGTNAEKMASQGLASTGYSESSMVRMYTAYQNRVATAKEVYNRAILNYDNAIKDAQLQNSSILAEIAYNTLQTTMNLSLQGLTTKTGLLKDKAATMREIDRDYYGRYRDEVNQINTENAQAENIRQFNASMKLEQDKWKWQKDQAKKKNSVSSKKKTSSKKTSTKKKTPAKKNQPKADKPKVDKPKDDKQKKEPTVDQKSVSSLGRGPISAAELDSLVRSGEVIEYEENGKLKYKNANKLKNPIGTANVLKSSKYLPASVKKSLGIK